MADNVGYTPGTGASVAADEIGGVLYQRVKPVFGVDGVATDVSATDPMPVTDANTQAIIAAMSGYTETIATLLALMFEKMPRTTGNDQMPVSIEAGSVGLLTNQTLTTVGILNDQAKIGGKFVSGDNQMLAGTAHIYNNIVVS